MRRVMPAQKRSAPPRRNLAASHQHPSLPRPPLVEKNAENPPPPPSPPPQSQYKDPTADEEDDSEDDEYSLYVYGGPDRKFMMLELDDIRREVQCAICLGVIQKTRAVMGCLHRFCSACIDKSMRIGNNECPACRIHCASRRSLRDDSLYDAIIGAIYPDIEKYEEQELAFYEEELKRNRKMQASIAETLQQQSEGLGKRSSVAYTRRSQGNLRNAQGQRSYSRGRGRSRIRNASFAVSVDEEQGDDVNSKSQGKDTSSTEEYSPDVRPKRYKRSAPRRRSPATTAGKADVGCVENDDTEVSRENHGMKPLRAGNNELLAWGKGGVRSQMRHGNNPSGSNCKFVKDARISKFVEYLRNLNEKNDEFDVHYTVLPLDEQSAPLLQRPHLFSPSTVAIGQLCQFIAVEAQSCLPEEVEIFIRRPAERSLESKPSNEMEKIQSTCAPSEELQIVRAEETLAGLCASLPANQGNLVLLYRINNADPQTKRPLVPPLPKRSFHETF